MRWRRVVLAPVVLLAAGTLAVGVLVGFWSAPRPSTGPGLSGLFGLFLGAVALLVVAVRSWRGPGPDDEPAPWTAEGAVVEQPPESTPDDVAVSGTGFAEEVASATRVARSAGDFRAGVDHVRAPLRETLGAALVASGQDPAAVERELAEGGWTDDRLAAAVLDEAVEPPERSFAERLRDWLFPERAVRRRVGRAVAAVDEATGVALPTVVGEDAPRTVPVVAPTLDDLQRTADGRLQRAQAVGDGGWGRREPRQEGHEHGETPSDRQGANGASGPDRTAESNPERNGDGNADWSDVAGGDR
jgi:hypothetical protein